MKELLSRRSLLWEGARAGLGGVAGAVAAFGTDTARAAGQVNVFVWLRGGADALSLLVPYRDDSYYRARPRTALLPPRRGARSALPLTPDFGLHPQLAPLLPAFAAGEATIVTAVGAAEFTGSHSDAGCVVNAALTRGWGAVQASDGEAPLATQLSDLGRLVLEGRAPHAALLESGGWDTHAAQGWGGQGSLSRAVDELARSLCDFRANLGNARRRVQIVVASEFGRSLEETPLGGTDDGHGTLALLLGGSERASPVIGEPPLLTREALSQGRHLLPSRDFDTLFSASSFEDPRA